MRPGRRFVALLLGLVLLSGACSSAGTVGGTSTTTTTTTTDAVAPNPTDPPATTSTTSRPGGSETCGPFTGQPFGRAMVAQAGVLQADGVRVEGAVYPRPDYRGKPWSQWGQGLVASDGRFFSAIGDHHGADGNSYVYEYDPATGELVLIADILDMLDHVEGEWGYGKVHAQMVPGPCGEVFFSTYWGTRRDLVFGETYRGDVLFRIDPATDTIEAIGLVEPEHGVPSMAAWPDGGLIYAEAVDPLRQGKNGPFVAIDAATGQVVFRDEDTAHVGYRNVAVDAAGRAYFASGGGVLSVYDPAHGSVSQFDATLPGDWLRASTTPTPDGTIYGVTREPDAFFALDPSGTIRPLGAARGYTTTMALHPDGDGFLYVPEAHGGSWEQGAPLIYVDGESGDHTVLVELNPLAEQHLGLKLGGTYSLAVDRDARVAYIGFNAGDPGQRSPFDEVVLMIVHLP